MSRDMSALRAARQNTALGPTCLRVPHAAPGRRHLPAPSREHGEAARRRDEAGLGGGP